MNTVILHGGLRERFGDKFSVSVRDPVEAYRALDSQLDGFRDLVRMGEFHIVREMPNGVFAITEEMLHLGMDNCRLHFLPAIDGAAKQGVGKAVLGVALIGASLFIPGGAIIGTMSLQTMGIMTGAALALGGVAMMLSPIPKVSTGKQDNKDSLLFSGDVNPSGQNLAVPIGFGKFRVPGTPVATQIVTNQITASRVKTRPTVLDAIRLIGGSYSED